MQHLFQSTFLQSLGYAIANSLWQTALLWLIYMSVTGLLSMSAAARYRLAVAAQVTGFVWFIITFQFYFRQYSHAWDHSGAVAVSRDIQNIVSSNTDISSRMINWMLKGEQLLPYVSMAYLLLMVFLCVRWFAGYRQTQLIRSNGLQKMPAEWRLFVERVSSQLGIKKKIQLFLSDTVTSPLTIGFLKPVILIPVASINHLTVDQLEAILLHELAHIKRYDYLVNILLSVVEISLFFNPFTQLLSKSIRKERENCCDDWVLQFQYNASVYAEALLRIAYLQSAPSFAMMAVTGKKNELLVRVKRMIDKKENRFSYRRQLLAFVIVTGILSFIAWLSPMKPHAETQTVLLSKKTTGKIIQPYAVEPMAVSVDNPLFNPVFFLSKPLKAEMQKSIDAAQKEMEAAEWDTKNAGVEIEALSPLVAGALEKASKAINFEMPDWQNNLAGIESVRSDLDRTLRLDSGFLPPKMRQKFKDDINLSIKQTDAELAKAKKEVERSLKLTADALDNDKINREVQQALESVDELKVLGLDKLVMSAVKIPGILFNPDKPRITKKEVPSPKAPAGLQRKKQLITEEKEMPAPPEPVSADEAQSIKIDDASISPGIITLSSFVNLDKLKSGVVVKLKNLVQQYSKEQKTKTITAINKETKPDDQSSKVIIQFQ